MAQTRKQKTPAQRGSIQRAIIYLKNLRWLAILPYIFMVIATFAQLAVPKLIGQVLNAVTTGVTSKTILEALGKIPPAYIRLPMRLKPLFSQGLPLLFLQRCVGFLHTSNPTGRNATRRVWLLICAMTFIPKSSGCPFLITTATKPVN
jgi:ABC-type multidrug transport system fused ATPase/permease subunit